MNITGPVHSWTIGKNTRRYSVVTLPFSQANKIFKSDHYNASTGKGEQRVLVPAHIRKLKKAMLDGTYTPTTFSAGLRSKHRGALTIHEDSTMSISIEENDYLPQTDGQQRFGAIQEIFKDATEKDEKALIAAIEQLPITVNLLLDGDTKEDFINLQQGKPVDISHMLSLRVQAKLLDDNTQSKMKLAMDVARMLNRHPKSPFQGLIRFDSRPTGAIGCIPITTLTNSISGDVANSLFGMAKVAENVFKPEELAHLVCEVYNEIKTKTPEVFEVNKPLTPPNAGGSKGSATMLIGVCTCMAYYLGLQSRLLPEQSDFDAMHEAIDIAMSHELESGLSSQDKRTLIREFAEILFEKCECDKHEKIPVGLLKSLSCSTFGVSSLPTKKAEAA